MCTFLRHWWKRSDCYYYKYVTHVDDTLVCCVPISSASHWTTTTAGQYSRTPHMMCHDLMRVTVCTRWPTQQHQHQRQFVVWIFDLWLKFQSEASISSNGKCNGQWRQPIIAPQFIDSDQREKKHVVCVEVPARRTMNGSVCVYCPSLCCFLWFLRVSWNKKCVFSHIYVQWYKREQRM